MHVTLRRPLMAALLAGALLALVFALVPSSPAGAQTPITARHDTISVHCDVDLDATGRALVRFADCGRFNGSAVVHSGIALTGSPQFIGVMRARNVTHGVPGPVTESVTAGTAEGFRIRIFTVSNGRLTFLPNDVVRIQVHATAASFDDDQDPEPAPAPSPTAAP
jgi:hypothetical protein